MLRGETRNAAAEALEEKSRGRGCEPCWRNAYRTITTLRNTLAHGIPPQDRRFRDRLASPEKLRAALQSEFEL